MTASPDSRLLSSDIANLQESEEHGKTTIEKYHAADGFTGGVVVSKRKIMSVVLTSTLIAGSAAHAIAADVAIENFGFNREDYSVEIVTNPRSAEETWHVTGVCSGVTRPDKTVRFHEGHGIFKADKTVAIVSSYNADKTVCITNSYSMSHSLRKRLGLPTKGY